MPVMEGWELSSDRKDVFDKMVSSDPIGDVLITSKCKLGSEHGTLLVSDNGFAWRLKVGFNTPMYKTGTSKWVRWHDVSQIIPLNEAKGVLKIECFKRKKGSLIMKKGNPAVFAWKATLEQNKGEDKVHFTERRKDFYRIMSDIFEKNKTTPPPEISDSRV